MLGPHSGVDVPQSSGTAKPHAKGLIMLCLNLVLIHSHAKQMLIATKPEEGGSYSLKPWAAT